MLRKNRMVDSMQVSISMPLAKISSFGTMMKIIIMKA